MDLRLVEPSIHILNSPEELQEIPRKIERAGRTCYRSEEKMTQASSEKFCRMLRTRGHESVFEHYNINVRLTCSRDMSHQIVRHRLCAYSQESQRYCGYEGLLDVIEPMGIERGTQEHALWFSSVRAAANTYEHLLKTVKPEVARSVLPNCVATRMVMSANVRQWRHIFRMRVDSHAQPSTRSLFHDMLKSLVRVLPCLFDDLDWRLENQKYNRAVFRHEGYVFPAGDEELQKLATAMVWEDMMSAIRYDELDQYAGIENAPRAKEEDIPAPIKEIIQERRDRDEQLDPAPDETEAKKDSC